MGISTKTWVPGLLLLQLCMNMEFLSPVNAHKEAHEEMKPTGSPFQSVDANACFPGVFIFGDSLVDDGNALAVYPDKLARLAKDPFGVTWPGHASDRFSDGKLIGDYLSWGVGGYPMSPYLRSIQTLFVLGVNLAASGSTVLQSLVQNPILQEDDVFPHTPFTLQQQIEWYKRFKYRVSELSNGNSMQVVLNVNSFNSSLHLVVAGYTDYIVQYMSGMSQSLIRASVLEVVDGISEFVETLYNTQGVTNILVVNLPPLGCTPAFLTVFGGNDDDYDHYGCLTSLNRVILSHNRELFRAVVRLRDKYSELSLSYGNYYGAFREVLKHPRRYGFNSTRQNLLRACCGAGGNHNFALNVTCGVTGFAHGKLYNGTACNDPSNRVFWDGFHPSSAINRIAALSFLNGTSLYPSDGLTPNDCKPDFSMFNVKY